ncbi:MAG: extracellular solute-binding protein, partial [Propionibacteriaceae bacterium]|nr:extracellular solute-binding protein [Propionibacteriaceae bacterium]
MKLGSSIATASLAGLLACTMVGCGSSPGSNGANPAPHTPATIDTPVSLTMSAWSLSTTPEFQALIEAFKKVQPNVTITIKEYAADKLEPLLRADMTAKTAPDIITFKNAKYVPQWATGGQLMDVSDLVASLPDNVIGAASYDVDGKYYGVPYRQDSWLLFYNKALFEKAGVAIPDGSWTWDDYVKAAKDLTAQFAAAGSSAKGTFEHPWQQSVQGFANAQAGKEDDLNGPYYSGDFDYMLPFYQRALDLQDSGAQVNFGEITTNKLTYQTQFGKQSTAMLLMGSWYIATLMSQQKTGDADTFDWGIAPAPQIDSSTVKNPVTFGSPTGMGINTSIDPAKVQAAKDFLSFIWTEDAAKAIAAVGITPAMTSETVTQAIFAVDGMP